MSLTRVPSGTPDDSDRFVTTYGYVRQLARRGDLVAEGYSEDIRRERDEADMWRAWALGLEALVMRAHPASNGGARCPGCGRACPCPTRREALRIRKAAIQEQELRTAEHIEREAQHGQNRLASIRRDTKLTKLTHEA